MKQRINTIIPSLLARKDIYFNPGISILATYITEIIRNVKM